MAADRTRLYSLRGPLVLAILAVTARRRRAARRARSVRRPYDRVALGAAVRSRTGAAHAAASQADQQILAGGRDLHSRAGTWCYPSIDSTGATADFLLSALRDAEAAKRLFRKALSRPSHPQASRHQRGSGTDLRLGYP